MLVIWSLAPLNEKRMNKEEIIKEFKEILSGDYVDILIANNPLIMFESENNCYDDTKEIAIHFRHSDSKDDIVIGASFMYNKHHKQWYSEGTPDLSAVFFNTYDGMLKRFHDTFAADWQTVDASQFDCDNKDLDPIEFQGESLDSDEVITGIMFYGLYNNGFNKPCTYYIDNKKVKKDSVKRK